MPDFTSYIGIDYSGAGAPDSPQAGLRVFQASVKTSPCEIRPGGGKRGWSRMQVSEWLRLHLDQEGRCLVGIDHAFGFPVSYLNQHGLKDYREFLGHVTQAWPTDRLSVAEARAHRQPPAVKEGYRLCDRWTASAKSLFLFDVPGSVASSTLGGMPGLRALAGRKDTHLWPFDGWIPRKTRHVVAEVYPSLWRRRFESPVESWSGDQRDAWTVAHWLKQADQRGILTSYWQPPLTSCENRQGRREGWILGMV